MKKFNKNIIVFIFAVLFIVAGIWGECFQNLKTSLAEAFHGLKSGDISSVLTLKYNLDHIPTEKLSYHDELMDINSLKENLLGTKIIEKEDTTVIKSDSDSLIAAVQNELNKSEIDEVVKKIEDLKIKAEENNAEFLYLAVPTKANYNDVPSNIHNYSKTNYDNFISALGEREIPLIDFTKTLKSNNINDDDIFFVTDHHWKPYSGFIATKAICEELNKLYGFNYNKDYVDINNYNIDTYEKYFLGSYGKKTGTYFTWKGADNIDIITPNFKTDFIEEQPFKEQIRKGSFTDTVMYMENINTKDYYKINSYATYSGGDFRLQIMKNNLNKNGKKILLIRDSFACVVAPFLSLQASELHIVDTRDYEYYVGDKVNVYDYIKEINPDYVLVLYSGINNIKNTHDKYNFN